MRKNKEHSKLLDPFHGEATRGLDFEQKRSLLTGQKSHHSNGVCARRNAAHLQDSHAGPEITRGATSKFVLSR